jgi:hypothetical protein
MIGDFSPLFQGFGTLHVFENEIRAGAGPGGWKPSTNVGVQSGWQKLERWRILSQAGGTCLGHYRRGELYIT